MTDLKFNREQEEFNKVVDLLTPRFCPDPELNKRGEGPVKKQRNPLRLWLWSGVASAVALLLTFTMNFELTASSAPEEIVENALNAVVNAETVKIDFSLLGKRSLKDDDIYTAHPEGEIVDGTICFFEKEGIGNRIRIDWHDAEKNSILFDGDRYYHLVNGKVVNSHPSKLSNKLKKLLSLENVKSELPQAEITEDGDRIVFTLRNEERGLIFRGDFSRRQQRLEKASVSYVGDGNSLLMLETKSVDYGLNLPESMFEAR